MERSEREGYTIHTWVIRLDLITLCVREVHESCQILLRRVGVFDLLLLLALAAFISLLALALRLSLRLRCNSGLLGCGNASTTEAICDHYRCALVM